MEKFNPIFIEENDKLKNILKFIKGVISELKAKLPKVSRYAVAHSYDEIDRLKYEKAELAQGEKQIAQYEDYLSSPYFGRIDLIENGAKYKTFYIGEHGFNNGEYKIYNWQAEMLFNKLYSRESDFEYNGINYHVRLKRRLVIEKSILNDCADLYDATQEGEVVVITDPFLIKLLSEKKKAHKLTNIIKSIQENQGKIIEFDIDKSFVVQGCAGSGKSMILLHRLSYIKYNKPNLNLNSVKVITPSKSFNDHIYSLIANLELTNINISDLINYYLALLRRYEQEYSSWKLVKNYMKQYDSVNVFVDDFDDIFLNYIYSADFKFACINLIEEYFAKSKYSTALTNIETVCNSHNYNIHFNSEFSERYFGDKYRDFIYRIITLNDERLKKYNSHYRILERNRRTDSQKVKSINDHISKLEKEIKGNESKVNKLRKTDPRINLDYINRLEDKILEALFKIDELKESLLIEQEKFNDVEKKISDFKNSIGVLASNELQLISDFGANFNPRIVYNSTIGHMLKEKYKEFNIDTSTFGASKLYRFQMYSHLLFWYGLRGEIDNADKYLHIDEGQDISASEYELLAKIHKNAIFNIYGDVNQLVSYGRGIGNWDLLNSILSIDNTFSLNENYRNSIEVTEYCNETFGFTTTAIGVSAKKVQHISVSEFVSKLLSVKKGVIRTAVIAKDETILMQIVGSLSERNSNASYWNVKMVKGIEFDTVYVLNQDLTDNEKYVAYTRALNDLIIVK